METLLKLSLFFALLTIGASLECEFCSSNETTCTGQKKKCEENEETCIIILTESTVDGPSVTKIEKRCETMFQCSLPPIYFTLGNGRRFRQSWACCIDNCANAMPVLIPIQTRVNGITCPACHEWKETCQTQMANCTGMETSCFKISSHIDSNGTHIDRTMMGCTTKYTCAAIESETTNFRPNSAEAVQAAECIPDTSRGSRSSGLLLPTFSGLLLLKILL
ncbi:phospholipase A2 inhibitor and Ly6/PLAUR domain-containing protein-like [Rhineura floridana]|uniref:phospholipase A2 inhibitor and Ly6/PLAUR domain-containing protein-like n=1 Tax=Rhineura floridana TaxID=261503 RepID=UPI002AC815E3|nr:phospholipase A2 inhibitor and Ly6/PLAUR domain-containing protein-like [Rhineura floridana]